MLDLGNSDKGKDSHTVNIALGKMNRPDSLCWEARMRETQEMEWSPAYWEEITRSKHKLRSWFTSHSKPLMGIMRIIKLLLLYFTTTWPSSFSPCNPNMEKQGKASVLSYHMSRKLSYEYLQCLEHALLSRWNQEHLAYLIVGRVWCASIIPSVMSTSWVELRNLRETILSGEDGVRDLWHIEVGMRE